MAATILGRDQVQCPVWANKRLMHVSGHVGARTDIAFGKSCLSRIGAEAGLRLSVPRMLRSAQRLRRDALLIRGPSSNSLMGPGSAEQREKRCTASGHDGLHL